MVLDDLDWRLMNEWQRGLPLVSHPFEIIAEEYGVEEDQILGRIQALLETGAISRIGATCRPNTIGASTLAAISVPEHRIESVAEIINAEEGVNHSYLRENKWNIWFVATGPSRKFVDDTLARISKQTLLRVLDLRLVQPFNVDLGFALDGTNATPAPKVIDEKLSFKRGDDSIVQALSNGMAPVPAPFEALARSLGRSEADVLDRIRALAGAGMLSRIGLIVRHRSLGWRSNAMCVFDIPKEDITRVGRILTDIPGVTLCYERRPVPDVWPYTLYCMIHGRSRSEALDVLSHARVHANLTGYDYKVLFSTRCFKQRGALVAQKETTR